ncbi:hypothetical protein CHS0354_015521 [Potamilus streckersoni]|uniref:Uncharacterized protein n=1 Tax=Potamilus streckersoni TaxID=2493646 RepID=A0AAE0SFJ9_9BIVA|nr:hypothetical protein CHS0354_015521 [Potamilus streckersoni]
MKGCVRPLTIDYNHQDSLFGNSFSSKAYFVVHPEWRSEYKDPPKSVPLNRPPWPWEQPRYRQNIQRPITYEPQPVTKDQETKHSPPPLPYELPKGYTFTHPISDVSKSDIKTTLYGLPCADPTRSMLHY